ncbi:TetR/AcrR family transcriptional regulator [Streptomyces sp. NPDC002454]|uniref:TetR/AcrR family transcriptional regulator n=1 Tax=Streptomyces sp. NPDC002490 TaxID=3154416 RepID=UPI003324D2F3
MPNDRTVPDRPPARTRILDAAHELMRTVGIGRATTKEIARTADCSEAALYKYFTNKEEVFVTVLEERLPPLGPLMERLVGDPGTGEVEDNLTEIARLAALFYEQSFPIGVSLFAEMRLKRRHDDALRQIGAGPHLLIDGLAEYLRAEQRAGRVHPDADPHSAAALLMGACCQRAFVYDATESGTPPQSLDEFARSAARTLLAGLR